MYSTESTNKNFEANILYLGDPSTSSKPRADRGLVFFEATSEWSYQTWSINHKPHSINNIRKRNSNVFFSLIWMYYSKFGDQPAEMILVFKISISKQFACESELKNTARMFVCNLFSVSLQGLNLDPT